MTGVIQNLVEVRSIFDSVFPGLRRLSAYACVHHGKVTQGVGLILVI